jgi:hypothetical protein
MCDPVHFREIVCSCQAMSAAADNVIGRFGDASQAIPTFSWLGRIRADQVINYRSQDIVSTKWELLSLFLV